MVSRRKVRKGHICTCECICNEEYRLNYDMIITGNRINENKKICTDTKLKLKKEEKID